MIETQYIVGGTLRENNLSGKTVIREMKNGMQDTYFGDRESDKMQNAREE